MNMDIRRLKYRLGRTLYMRARLEVSNFIESNGEQRLQREALQMFQEDRINQVIFDVGANVGE